MPYGMNIGTCHACGAQFVCGDCILSVCADCEAKGHTNSFYIGCPVCEREARERRKRIDAALAAAVARQSIPTPPPPASPAPAPARDEGRDAR